MNDQITVTHGDIQGFVQAATQYLNQPNLKPSHLSLAISKELKLLKPYTDEYDDLVIEKRIDLAVKDKDGVIELHPNGSYKMKASAAKDFQAAVREIQSREVQVTPYYAKTVPKNLALPWYEYFIPFVIGNYPEPTEESTEE